MMMDDSASANAMLSGDKNAMTIGNEIKDSTTQNAVEQGLTTNDADTNLATKCKPLPPAMCTH
jgi:lipopolysaccharide export system protein LptC